MSQAPATLKLVALATDSEATAAALSRELEGLAGDDDLRMISERAFVVHTALTTAELRDRISLEVSDGDSLMVVEFEKWSGYGPEIDSVWLMRRGH